MTEKSLVVGDQKIQFINTTNRKNSTAFDIHILNKNCLSNNNNNTNERSYYDNKHQLRLSDQVNLLYNDCELIPLPNKIKSRLLKYFKAGGNASLLPGDSNYFDCISFVHYLHRVSYPTNEINESSWTISKHDINQSLKIGDTIITSAQVNRGKIELMNNFHASMYIGRGLFIGKAGATGSVMIFTMDAIQDLFPFSVSNILKIVPKK